MRAFAPDKGSQLEGNTSVTGDSIDRGCKRPSRFWSLFELWTYYKGKSAWVKPLVWNGQIDRTRKIVRNGEDDTVKKKAPQAIGSRLSHRGRRIILGL